MTIYGLDEQDAAARQDTAPGAPPSIAPRPNPPFQGVLGYKVTRAGGIDALGRMSDPEDARNPYAGAISRSLVFGGRLVTISDRGIGVGSLTSFERTGFAAFDQG